MEKPKIKVPGKKKVKRLKQTVAKLVGELSWIRERMCKEIAPAMVEALGRTSGGATIAAHLVDFYAAVKITKNQVLTN